MIVLPLIVLLILLCELFSFNNNKLMFWYWPKQIIINKNILIHTRQIWNTRELFSWWKILSVSLFWNQNCNGHRTKYDYPTLEILVCYNNFLNPQKQQSLLKTMCQLLLKPVQSTTFTNMVWDGLEQFSSSLLFHMIQGRRDSCVLIPWPMAGFQHLAPHSMREWEWCSYSPCVWEYQRDVHFYTFQFYMSNIGNTLQKVLVC